MDWALVVHFCKLSIQKKITDFRYEWKKLYKAAKTEEECKMNSNKYMRITQGDWDKLLLL